MTFFSGNIWRDNGIIQFFAESFDELIVLSHYLQKHLANYLYYLFFAEALAEGEDPGQSNHRYRGKGNTDRRHQAYSDDKAKKLDSHYWSEGHKHLNRPDVGIGSTDNLSTLNAIKKRK